MFGLFKPKGEAAVKKAVEFYQSGQKAQALELALHGGKTGAPTGWGVAAGLYLEMGRYQECLAAAETVLGTSLPDQNKAAAWNAKGQALASLGRMAEARECYGPCMVQVAQALNLATILAWQGEPAEPLTELGQTGVKAWFPGSPRPRQAGGVMQYAHVTPEFSYLVVRQPSPPPVEDPEKGLLTYLQDTVDTRTWEMIKLEVKPPYLSYGAFDGLRLQVGRLWLSGVQARVTILDLALGAAPEPGRFLASIRIAQSSPDTF